MSIFSAESLSICGKKRYQQALGYLKTAYESPESQATHAYIYAIALDNQMHTNTAIKILKAALNRWPQSQELTSLLASYQQKNAK